MHRILRDRINDETEARSQDGTVFLPPVDEETVRKMLMEMDCKKAPVVDEIGGIGGRDDTCFD